MSVIRMTDEQYAAHQARIKGVRKVTLMPDKRGKGVKPRKTDPGSGRPGVERALRKICEVCGEHFLPEAKQLKKGQGRFCSNVCKGKAYTVKYAAAANTATCEHCSVVFRKAKSLIAEGRGKYCSKACMVAAKTPAPRACSGCGIEFTGRPGSKYCSTTCGVKARSGEVHPLWNGGPKKAICVSCGVEHVVLAGSKGLVCSLKCYGAIAAKLNRERGHSCANGGKRADLDGQYFRSSWEANWARYLNWLKANGQLKDWQYEPDTFEFNRIKRGTKFYTPDFKLFETNGDIHYHEVKGWMDQKSATKLNRMKRYHPKVKVTVIDKTAYRSVSLSIGPSLRNWEKRPGATGFRV